MSMSNDQVVERSREIKARRTGFDQMVNEVQASNAVDSPAERPPVADAVTEAPQTEKSEGGGGCGSSFMKIFTVIVAAVVSYFVPAAAPAMAQMAAAALSVPEAGEGAAEREGVSEEVRQRFEDIEDSHYGQDGIAGTDDDPYGRTDCGDHAEANDFPADSEIAGVFAALGLGEPEDHFRAYLIQQTGLGEDATWEELLAAYGARSDSDQSGAHAVSALPSQPVSHV